VLGEADGERKRKKKKEEARIRPRILTRGAASQRKKKKTSKTRGRQSAAVAGTTGNSAAKAQKGIAKNHFSHNIVYKSKKKDLLKGCQKPRKKKITTRRKSPSPLLTGRGRVTGGHENQQKKKCF